MNPLRSRLQAAFKESLKQIKDDNCTTILLGEDDLTEGNLKYIKAPDGTKRERLTFALNYLKTHNIAYNYIARFDDDDLLNPNFISILQSLPEADCYYDKWHAYFDLYSAQHTHEPKDWMANTVFMKKEHALSVMKDGRTLIEQDHAEEWYLYFEDKTLAAFPKERPIYLRILSPGSVTANSKEEQSYQEYLAGQCKWNKQPNLKDFSFKSLQNIHDEFYPKGKLNLPKKSILSKIKSLLNGAP